MALIVRNFRRVYAGEWRGSDDELKTGTMIPYCRPAAVPAIASVGTLTARA
jgi:hypothetical protein